MNFSFLKNSCTMLVMHSVHWATFLLHSYYNYNKKYIFYVHAAHDWVTVYFKVSLIVVV